MVNPKSQIRVFNSDGLFSASAGALNSVGGCAASAPAGWLDSVTCNQCIKTIADATVRREVHPAAMIRVFEPFT